MEAAIAASYKRPSDVIRKCLLQASATTGQPYERVVEIIYKFTLPPPPIQQCLLEMICFQHINRRLGTKLLVQLQQLQQLGQVTHQNLINAGFSTKKADAVLSTIAFFRTHRYDPRQLSTDEAIDFLAQIPGVGKWTAKMCLINAEGRSDILLVEDLEFRKGLALVYKLEKTPTIPQATKLMEEFDRNTWTQRSVMAIQISRLQYG